MPKLRALSLIKRVYGLVRGVGRKRLVLAAVMVVAQGLAQVVGVTSIFPFLQIATDPESFRSSRFASWLPIAELSDKELLLWSGGLCIGLLFASNMISLAAIVTRARYVQGAATHIRKRLMRDVLAQPYGFFLKTNSSELYQRIQVDVQQFANNILQPLLNVLSSALTVGLLLITIIVAQPAAALIAVFGVAGFAFQSWLLPLALLGVAVVIGTWAGSLLLDRVSETTFVWLYRCVLTLIALRLLLLQLFA